MESPSPDHAEKHASVLDVLKTTLMSKIEEVTNSITGSVMAVANAFSMHADEVAHAYAGTCPDQGPDVDPLDLDSDYVTLLDALRRTRPDAYKVLVLNATDWHDSPPLLYEQPAKMTALAIQVAKALGVSSPPLETCVGDVAAAVAASLSTAIVVPDPPPPSLTPGSSGSGPASLPPGDSRVS